MTYLLPPILRALLPVSILILMSLMLAVFFPSSDLNYQVFSTTLLVALVSLGLFALKFKFTEIFFASLIMAAVVWVYALLEGGSGQVFQKSFLYSVLAVTVPIAIIWASSFHRLSLRAKKLLPFYWLLVMQVMTLPLLYSGFWSYLSDETHYQILTWLGDLFQGAFLLGNETIMPVHAVSGLITIIGFGLVFFRFTKEQRPEQALLLGLLFSFYLISLSPTNRHMVIFLCAGTTSIIALGLSQAVHRLAFIDELTNIPTRRSYDFDMRSLTSPYSIGVLDIDHFKKLNDTYGHDVGDQVLKMVAKKLTMLGSAALVYRYGGEEFILLFKGKNKQSASYFAEALRTEIAESEFIIRSQKRAKGLSEDTLSKEQLNQMRQGGAKENTIINVTVSIGLADDKDATHPLDVQKRADEQLYNAKKQGRNCTVLSP